MNEVVRAALGLAGCLLRGCLVEVGVDRTYPSVVVHHNAVLTRLSTEPWLPLDDGTVIERLRAWLAEGHAAE